MMIKEFFSVFFQVLKINKQENLFFLNAQNPRERCILKIIYIKKTWFELINKIIGKLILEIKITYRVNIMTGGDWLLACSCSLAR
jgi:hypothetical protein